MSETSGWSVLRRRSRDLRKSRALLCICRIFSSRPKCENINRSPVIARILTFCIFVCIQFTFICQCWCGGLTLVGGAVGLGALLGRTAPFWTATAGAARPLLAGGGHLFQNTHTLLSVTPPNYWTSNTLKTTKS